MKSFVAISTTPPAKRRWRAPAAVVLVLVFFSLLVPLDFLLGLHDRFPSGYLTDDRRPPDANGSDLSKTGDLLNQRPDTNSTGQLVVAGKGTGSNSKEINLNSRSQIENTSTHYKPEVIISHRKAFPKPQVVPSRSLPDLTAKLGSRDVKKSNAEGGNGDGIRKDCQFTFGSYCVWSTEHKEVMDDSTVKKLKDQLFVARAYYPSLAKLNGQQKLSHDMKQNIQEHEHMLSEAIVDADLPPFVEKKIQKMEQTIARTKACTVDCKNVDKKLRQILDLTEDEANFHLKQSAFLYQLGVQTMPKSLHCLSMRLTVEFFKSLSADSKNSHPNKLDSPNLMHFVIFSKNILAAAVTINSTVVNSQVSQNMIFHVVTDAQNYFGMKLWFVRNSYKEATIVVINFEELNLEHLHNDGLTKLSLPVEFRAYIHKTDQPTTQMSTKYITVFGHSHYLLPEIFKNLKRVVVLDDDVVVQHDLSSLWNLHLQGKVNGAIEFCRLRFGQLKMLLGRNSYDADSCAWMSGLNIIDLEKWREHNVTRTYLQLLESFGTKNEVSLRAAAFPAGLLALKNLIYPLSERWSLLGLGHNYSVNVEDMKTATSLHYNGQMKPWLDLGIPEYKKYWKIYLTQDEKFMDECNVNP
ncbi:probable galacturonosyltransferase 7 isoform X3 [Musa acuminata AAA Group]|uniref:probable galacturonosyltransferase 7 isoform X3 n=1 Tax=Musa acuminata AAA Group TaxID=214697 RepID=UPI0031DA19FF